jgi:hypothetical protein
MRAQTITSQTNSRSGREKFKLARAQNSSKTWANTRTTQAATDNAVLLAVLDQRGMAVWSSVQNPESKSRL